MDGELIRVSDIIMFGACEKDSKRVFDVYDVILTRQGSVEGLILSGRGVLAIKRYANSRSILSINAGNVTVSATTRFKPKLIRNKSVPLERIMGKRVITEDNEFLGNLSDVYINTETLKVMAVEVARSLFEDLFTGRLIIPGSIIECTGDVLISELQIEHSMHNTKGIINAIDETIRGE
ncbi:MAG: hypothetical protein E7312_07205 [Clostridiales bacterium]|nr:hypothetical protein [Clostridiales bacterium]